MNSDKSSNNRKANLYLFVCFFALIICVFLAFYYRPLVRLISHKSRHERISGFGINIPQQYTVHGIDVSYYQGEIDWSKAKKMSVNGVSHQFVFIKATEGLYRIDRKFKRNWVNASDAGFHRGAYHFFRSKFSGREQAIFFLRNVKLVKGDLPPVLDIETLDGISPAQMRVEIKAFVDYIEQQIAKKPIIYSGLKFYHDYLRGYINGCPLWIAHYHKRQLKVAKGEKWTFWQHSDRGRVKGIKHSVDFNVFNGSVQDFQELLL